MAVEPLQDASIAEKGGANTTSSTNATQEMKAKTEVREGGDPSMPVNWPMGKKAYNLIIPSVLCFVV